MRNYPIPPPIADDQDMRRTERKSECAVLNRIRRLNGKQERKWIELLATKKKQQGDDRRGWHVDDPDVDGLAKNGDDVKADGAATGRRWPTGRQAGRMRPKWERNKRPGADG